MGYNRDHAIVVSSWSEKGIEAAHAYAEAIFPWVSPISPPATNGNRAFFIPPDGSKEGWEESDIGDRLRKQMCDHLEWMYANSLYCNWVEVQYGDDNGEDLVVRSQDTWLSQQEEN